MKNVTDVKNINNFFVYSNHVTIKKMSQELLSIEYKHLFYYQI